MFRYIPFDKFSSLIQEILKDEPNISEIYSQAKIIKDFLENSFSKDKLSIFRPKFHFDRDIYDFIIEIEFGGIELAGLLRDKYKIAASCERDGNSIIIIKKEALVESKQFSTNKEIPQDFYFNNVISENFNRLKNKDDISFLSSSGYWNNQGSVKENNPSLVITDDIEFSTAHKAAIEKIKEKLNRHFVPNKLCEINLLTGEENSVLISYSGGFKSQLIEFFKNNKINIRFDDDLDMFCGNLEELFIKEKTLNFNNIIDISNNNFSNATNGREAMESLAYHYRVTCVWGKSELIIKGNECTLQNFSNALLRNDQYMELADLYQWAPFIDGNQIRIPVELALLDFSLLNNEKWPSRRDF